MSTPGWGGYRAPSSPAAVSGPGALSARTDGGVMDPNSPSYGEVADVQSLASSSPMAAPAAATGSAPAGVDLTSVVGLGDTSRYPDQPVTSGAALGAGPGADALGLPQTSADRQRADVRAIGPGAVQAMVAAASRADATPSFKALVRAVVFS